MSFAWAIRATLNNTGSPFALSGFQVPIDMTSSWASDIFSKARSDGADIAIYDLGGTLQNFWLEYFTPGSSIGRLWLNVPSQSIGSSTTYQIVYDDPARSTSLGSFTNVFQKQAIADIGSGNVVCLFRFDDGSGSSPTDASGNISGGNSTVVNGPPTWGANAGGQWIGYNGTAGQSSVNMGSGSFMTLNGTNQCHKITGLLDTVPAAGCLMGWFKPTSTINNTTTGAPHLWSKMSNGSGGTSITSGTRAFFNTDGTLHVESYNPSFPISGGPPVLVSSTNTWTAGTWYHVAFVWDTSILELWVNGKLQASVRTNQFGNNGQWPGGSANPFAFGCFFQENSNLQFFNASPQNLFAGSFYQWAILSTHPTYDYLQAVSNWRHYQAGMNINTRLTKYVSNPVLPPSGVATSWNKDLVIEPSPVNVSGTIYMYMSGWDLANATTDTVGLLSSTDGKTFSTVSGVTNPLESGYHGSNVVFDGTSTYYWFLTPHNNQALYYTTSSDGKTWAAPATVTGMSVIGIGQSWCSSQVYNPQVFLDPNTSKWTLLLEGYNGTIYQAGLFTSSALTSGGTWTAVGTNPKTTLQYQSGGSYSHIHVIPRGGATPYDAYYHISASGFGPSYLIHATSNDLSTWTVDTTPILGLAAESFSGGQADQIADPRLFVFGGTVYLYYDLDRNDSGWNGQQGSINLVTYGSSSDSLPTIYPTQSYGSPTAPVFSGQSCLLLGVGS